ncbi:mRNA splicing protein [Lithohypha guttulata]|uniref:mRNA splicing protein n=1 Tax=Lithohypha guttulata TaxID=1690604 RepID=UPI002DDFCDEB|nr:mRNA splicing protein [Lithohypha guttulata]
MSRNPPPPPQNTNNGRNEYIPQYISAKPFYAEDLLKDDDYLTHQRSKAEQKDTIDKAKWYERGAKKGPAATKYRKGACENCGAMTHKTKDCLSRPRKTGAKWTGRDIQADEIVDDVKLGWDAKRDRWNGYDVREYDSVVKDYEDMENLRKVAAKSVTPANGEVDGKEDEVDGDHYAEETDMGRNQPTSTRQLRLREDTAKYLLNLDLDSAKYDPKTRSMDTTALALNNNKAGDDLASEGFVRPAHDPATDAAAFEKAQRYAWDAQNQSSTPHASTPTAAQIQNADMQVHLEANPTASALALKKHAGELAAKKEAQRKYLESNYGTSSAPALKRPLAVSNSAYTTYDPETGKELDPDTNKPRIKPIARSKYPEDVFPGEEGKQGFEAEEARRKGRDLLEEQHANHLEEDHAETIDEKKRKGTDFQAEDMERRKRNRTEDPF